VAAAASDNHLSLAIIRTPTLSVGRGLDVFGTEVEGILLGRGLTVGDDLAHAVHAAAALGLKLKQGHACAVRAPRIVGRRWCEMWAVGSKKLDRFSVGPPAAAAAQQCCGAAAGAAAAAAAGGPAHTPEKELRRPEGG
jgi:hypothetical protein